MNSGKPKGVLVMKTHTITRLLVGRALLAGLLMLGVAAVNAADLRSPAPDDAEVYFIEPMDDAAVAETFTVKFGLTGMGVAPAGIDMQDTGHHHLLIDVAMLPDMTMPLPATAQIVHFGKGQTETEVTLPPGVHSLQLLLGNHLHIPHDLPVLSDRITVTVE
jgi:hypothetical protein